MADGLPIPGAGAPGTPPPQGASPVQTPSPNVGLEVAGLAELSQVVRLLSNLVPKLGVSSEAGKAAAEAMLKLAKHVPTGSVAPGPQMAAAQNIVARQRQIQPMLSMIRGGASPAAPPGQPPMPPAA